MVFAQYLADPALPGPERIYGKHKVSQFCQADAAGLYDRILLGAPPVPVDSQNRRQLRALSAAPVRHVGVGGHPDAGQRLKDDLLDAVSIPLDLAQLAGIE